ncbi:MAG: FecCD family ABC transporter permease [Acidimicrobiia bacterium]
MRAGPRRVPAGMLLGGLAVALVVAVVVSAGMGAFSIAPLDVATSILRKVGLGVGSPLDEVAESVLWEIRFPRLVLTVLVGASLGGAGALMQGTFGNPLAEPGIVGVSSGAVLGAAAQIVIGFSPLGVWTLTGSAFLGGLVTVVAVYLTARAGGRTEVVTLVLTGVAVNALAGAIIGLFTFFSTDAELRSITFWTLGSVAQATWPKVVTVAPIALAGLALAVSRARQLDLLALGERPARHLGVDVERLRVTSMAVVALLTAASVAVSGVILFVGLVIPHLVRMVAGPGHRLLLPASALAGAVILVLADLAARTLAAPAEIPLGVLTSLIGSPFFFWQLRRTRASQGGWA